MKHPAALRPIAHKHGLGSLPPILNVMQVTVFAPTNDAFARALVALNTTAAAFLAPANAGVVTSILQYHIVDFKALSTDLQMGDTAVNTLSAWRFHACMTACAHDCRHACMRGLRSHLRGMHACLDAWCSSEKLDAMFPSCTTSCHTNPLTHLIITHCLAHCTCCGVS